MQVRRYTFERELSATNTAHTLTQAGVPCEGPHMITIGQNDLIVYVDRGQEPVVDRAMALYDLRPVQVEDVDPGRVVATTIRRRDRASGTRKGPVPFTSEQRGVRVTVESGETRDLPEGLGFDVGNAGNLHVYRGERRVALFRPGHWVSAERLFADRADEDLQPAP